LLRFASLASGSQGNCLVVEAGDAASTTRVLIDCGLNLRDTERRLARAGLQPCDIAAILVTHEHGDHGGGVFDFAAAHGVAVYLTYGTRAALESEGKVLDGVRTQLVNGKESVAIGYSMIPRGEVGLIIAVVAEQQGIIGPDLFAIIVIVMIVVTVLPAPLIRRAFLRIREEQAAPALDAPAGGGAT